MPDVVVITGPNGAGKSTLAPHLLRDELGIMEYVNADKIAEGLSAYKAGNVAIAAGRLMRERMNTLSARNADFAFETTLATRSYAKWLKKLQANGYFVHVVFLWLDSPELAIKRVAARVEDGGHDIPKDTIRRRYDRGLNNFFKLYKPIVDSWQMFDASEEVPVEVAFGAKIEGVTIVDERLWAEIEK